MNDSRQTGQNNDVRIQVLLSKLRQKLKELVVLDQQAIVLGKVQDVVLNSAKQLQLKIKLFPSDQNLPILTVGSKYIQRVDTQKNALFLDVSKVEILTMINSASQQPSDSSMNSEFPVNQESLEFNQSVPDAVLEDSADTPQVVAEEIVRLLEERVVVDTQRRKVGEVIVRKEITTEIVQVPVRREKLIVEQVSPTQKQLAEIDLGGENYLEFAAEQLGLDENVRGEYINQPANGAGNQEKFVVSGEFSSLRTAASLLNAIALERNVQCRGVRVELVMENAEQQKTYQAWFDRCSRPIPQQ